MVRATANEIIVLDSNGKEVWRSEVGGRISPGFVKDYKGRFAQVHDLDNDGRREVLVSIRGERNSPANGLRAFNEDGSPRFAYTPDARVRFGSQGYAGPWLSHYFWVVNEGDRTSIWATFTHGTDFPALLVELDLQGKERSRYWSNGYITSVSLLTWRGRRVVVVGAANNEWKGSSLAVFDRDKVVGTAPAANPKYRCTDCGAGLPRSFVVFPGWCIAQAYGGTGLVQELWLDDDGFLHVQIGAGVSMENGEYGATVWYVLRPDLTPASVDIIDYVRRLHDEYYAAGRLDHRFTQADAQRLFPLKIWKDGAYADLPPGKVTW